MDTVDAATRSGIMRAVPRSDTAPELLLRSALHRLGLRYRLHVQSLPGSPDIVFVGPRVVVFVHGCYWHRHEGCQLTTTPKSNADFWQKKFRDNIARDQRTIKQLKSDNWVVAIVWQCEVQAAPERVAKRIYSVVSRRRTFTRARNKTPTLAADTRKRCPKGG
ncbi:MAG: DNA mismatch endonuclease Vsr [Cyanobacteria bacterium SZAS LIN-2]|nr:DNA mismatch endonuclease Vsr [Cyanobacteria bacterium SZAS LIN-2]